MTEQFFRDGFIDRYSGEKLVNPGILRVISELMSDVFPFHPHWKTDKCHLAYWDFQPTIDHIIPIAREGKDEPDNWVSTSMRSNAVKGSYMLENPDRALKDKGDLAKWDGLSALFIQIVDQNTELKKIKKIREWYIATKKVMQSLGLINDIRS